MVVLVLFHYEQNWESKCAHADLTFGPHSHESPTPQLHMLYRIGRPVLFKASRIAVYLSTIQSSGPAAQLSYLRKSTPKSAKYCASSSSLPLLPGRPRQVLRPASLYIPYFSPVEKCRNGVRLSYSCTMLHECLTRLYKFVLQHCLTHAHFCDRSVCCSSATVHVGNTSLCWTVLLSCS